MIQTTEEILYSLMKYQTSDQIDEIVFIMGKGSMEEKVGKRILAERRAQVEKEERAAAAEKTAAGNLDGSTIPSRIPR